MYNVLAYFKLSWYKLSDGLKHLMKPLCLNSETAQYCGIVVTVKLTTKRRLDKTCSAYTVSRSVSNSSESQDIVNNI